MKRTLAILAALAALVLVPASSAHAETRGSSWQQPVVYVYDSTSAGSLYDVAGAAADWSASGVNLVMTSDPTLADITVAQENYCGMLQCYAGHYSSTESGGVIADCHISVDPGLSDDPKLGHYATLHEMGHCLGLEHNPVDVNRSVMNASTPTSRNIPARPSSYDIREVKSLYR
jgi:predicted Zn-dependent protease